MTSPAAVVSTSSHQAAGTDVACSREGRWVASAAFDQVVRVFAVATGRARWEKMVDSVPAVVTLSSDGEWLASADEDGTVQLLDAATGDERCRVEHEVRPRSAAIGLMFELSLVAQQVPGR